MRHVKRNFCPHLYEHGTDASDIEQLAIILPATVNHIRLVSAWSRLKPRRRNTIGDRQNSGTNHLPAQQEKHAIPLGAGDAIETMIRQQRGRPRLF